MGRDVTAQAANLNTTVWGDNIEVAPQFYYLGSIFWSDNTMGAEINHRVATGCAWY